MAGGQISKDDFFLLMADGLDTIFDEMLEKTPIGQWKDLFQIEDSKIAYEVMVGMVGMGMPSRKAEFEAPRTDQPSQGRPIKFVHITKAQEVRLSKEAKDDDRYGKLARMIVPEMMRNFRISQEYEHAQLFDLGFTTQGYEPDGVSLFNTAHPLLRGGGTSSNRSSTDAALSYTSLAAARATLRKTKTESGKLMPLTGEVLIVGPSQETAANELVNSINKPGQFVGGTQPNEKNDFGPNGTNRLRVKVWDYLDESLNPNAWFLKADADVPNLLHFTREALNTDNDYDKRVRALLYLMFERYSYGFRDWRGLYGSRGA